MWRRWARIVIAGCLCALALGSRAEAADAALDGVLVQVVGLDGRPVPGAMVVLAASGEPDTGRQTDAGGQALFDLRLTRPVNASVQVSKAGFRTARDVVPWNPTVSQNRATCTVTLARDDETVLVVTVRGLSGTLPNIPVTVAHNRAFGGGPTYRGTTGSDGVARIGVRTGLSVAERLTGTSFRVMAGDPAAADRADAREAVSALVSVDYRAPSRAVDLLMINGSGDTVSGMPVRVQVSDADGPVAGATVLLQQSGQAPRSAETDAAGEALVEASVIFASRVGIRVVKDGYLPGQAGVALNPRDRGKSVPVVTVALTKAPGTAARAAIQVQVSSAGVGIEGARVRLVPLADGAPLAGSTAASGLLQLESAARGRYRLEVLHRLHEFHSEEVDLDGRPASFQVALTPRPGARDDTALELLVTAADRRAADGAPLPLSGARVVAGSSSQVTDAAGRARVPFPGELGVTLRVEADGYRPAELSVDGGRYALPGSLKRAVQLQPAPLTDDTAFDLVIRIAEDVEPFMPMPGVAFRLRLADGGFFGGEHETDATGERSLRVPAHLAARVRRGLSVVVAASSEHGPADTAMAPDQLVPSTEPRRHLVLLRSTFGRDLAALQAQVPRLEALKREVEQRLDDAWAERDRTPGLLAALTAQIDARFGGKLQATPFQQMQQNADQACDRAARTAREHAREAQARSDDALRLIEAAQREAAVCTSPESAARIDAGHRALLMGIGDFARLQQRARLDAQTFAQQVAGLEQEADDPLERVRRTVDQVERAAQGAAASMADARRLAASLREGHAQAVASLNALRGRRSLRPDQLALTQDLRRRLTPLPFDLEPPKDPARLARADADAAAQQLRELQARAASFGRQGCVEARAAYPRLLDSLEADRVALEFTLARAELPRLAEGCRERLASQAPAGGTTGGTTGPAAGAASATVPDLGVLPKAQWLAAAQAAGLSWGGVIPLAEAAPSAAQAQGFARQSVPPGTAVPRGTPLTVFVWGAQAPPVSDPPTSTPATEAPTAVPPASTPAPSIWDRLVRGVAAATPGIVAAVQQSRGQRPGPAVTPATVPAAPSQPGGTSIGVPNVWGESLEQAQRRLEAVGIAVRGVSRGGKPPSPELAGRVYHQNPAAGTALMRGMAADLMVYDNDRSTVTPPAPPPQAASTRYDRPTQGGLPIHACATAGSGGDCGNEGAQYFCVQYKGHQRLQGFRTYTVPQSFRLKDGTRCVQGLCPALLEVVCQ